MNFCFWRDQKIYGDENRIVQINVRDKNFCTNGITTGRYTVWNFVPKNLIEQFTKPSNTYFLFVLVLQCIPEITTTNGYPTLALPVGFMVLINALKDALEEIRRHNNDRHENNQKCSILSLVSERDTQKENTVLIEISQQQIDLGSPDCQIRRQSNFGLPPQNASILLLTGTPSPEFQNDNLILNNEMTICNESENNLSKLMSSNEIKKEIPLSKSLAWRSASEIAHEERKLHTSNMKRQTLLAVEEKNWKKEDEERNDNRQDANKFLSRKLNSALKKTDDAQQVDNIGIANIDAPIVDANKKPLASPFRIVIEEEKQNENYLKGSGAVFSPDVTSRASVEVNNVIPLTPMEQTNASVEIIKNRLTRLNWSEIKVGDVLVLFENDPVPVDCVVLCSSDDQGLVFIETSSLDGETNLKIRSAKRETQDIFTAAARADDKNPSGIEHEINKLETIFLQALRSDLVVECGSPNPDLRVFDGILKIQASHIYSTEAKSVFISALKKQAEQNNNLDFNFNNNSVLELSIDLTQLLVRGCRIKTTSWALVLSLFTGKQSKLLLNSPEPVRKISTVEKKTTLITISVFVILFIFCLILAIASVLVYNNPEKNKLAYLGLKAFIDPNNPAAELQPLDRILRSSGIYGFCCFLTGIVLLSNFVPISLLVTTALVKGLQAYHMSVDKDMYNAANNTYATPRTSDLNEELGQVSYILTDKTGTLTANEMEYRKCSVGSISYGDGYTQIQRLVLKSKGIQLPADDENERSDQPIKLPNGRIVYPTPHVRFSSPLLFDHLNGIGVSRKHLSKLISFYFNLAINHTVVVENSKRKAKDKIETIQINDSVKYSASSPDEGCLVYGAAHFSFKFIGRNDSIVSMSILGFHFCVELVALYEFTSERKRSSAVVKIPKAIFNLLLSGNLNAFKNEFKSTDKFIAEDSEPFLFVKGAESVIIPRLKSSEFDRTVPSEPSPAENMTSTLKQFAEDGLRTLTIAGKALPSDEYSNWLKNYREASLALEDRNKKINATADIIEHNLDYFGITGIEDKLQEGVTESIESFLKAGMKVWMLTGDKYETALNISIGTNLITKNAFQINIIKDQVFGENANLKNEKDVIPKLLKLLKQILNAMINADNEIDPGPTTKRLKMGRTTNRSRSDISHGGKSAKQPLLIETSTDDLTTGINSLRTSSSSESSVFGAPFKKTTSKICDSELNSFALFCDGEILKICLENQQLENLLYQISSRCTVCVFFRAAPSEKGAVVKMIRKFEPKAVTLAVGDGANDCSMILQAHVGIGIRGNEGLQAFNTCDYGLPDFKSLKVLLLVHGRWNYRRISKLVLYTYYKNFILMLPVVMFTSISLWSAQKIYSEIMLQLYNMFFTTLPIMALSIWDQDVDRSLSLQFPHLYYYGIANRCLNVRVVLFWLFISVYHSLVVFFVPFMVFGGPQITSLRDLIPNDLWFVGNTILLCVIAVVNVKLVFETYCPNLLTWITILLSFLIYIIACLIQSCWPQMFPSTTGTFNRMLEQPMVYFAIAGSVFLALSIDLIVKVFGHTFKMDSLHSVQFLMKFRLEARKATEHLIVEAVRQGGPNVLMGFDDLDSENENYFFERERTKIKSNKINTNENIPLLYVSTPSVAASHHDAKNNKINMNDFAENNSSSSFLGVDGLTGVPHTRQTSVRQMGAMPMLETDANRIEGRLKNALADHQWRNNVAKGVHQPKIQNENEAINPIAKLFNFAPNIVTQIRSGFAFSAGDNAMLGPLAPDPHATLD